MTLDLGFAHMRFDDGTEAGIVDVPGHERFLHNMLAGAAEMELLLLLVAANEGPKPQTLEHLAILQYLNVKRTIVVLSKADLVEAAELEFVGELVGEAVFDHHIHVPTTRTPPRVVPPGRRRCRHDRCGERACWCHGPTPAGDRRRSAAGHADHPARLDRSIPAPDAG